MYVYSVFTVTKESVNWSAGSFGTLIHCFTYLWFQQPKIWSLPIQFYLLPILVNERNFETNVIKKRTSLCQSNWIIGTFLEAQQVLIPPWRHKKLQRKRFFTCECFDHPDKMQNTELLRMMLSTVNFAAATLLQPNTRTMLTFWKVDWPQNKQLSNWNCGSHPLQEMRVIVTCSQYRNKNKREDHSKTFWGGITTKMLRQLWRQCKNWLPFTTTKISIFWSLVEHYQTWLNFAYTNLPMQKSIPSQWEIKIFWKKLGKRSLVVDLLFLHTKQFLMKLLSKSIQTNASLLLGLMPAIYTPTRCVKPCPPFFIRAGISIQKLVDSHLDKTRPVVWNYGHVLFST